MDTQVQVSLWEQSFLRLKKNRAAVASCFVLIFILAACIIGPFLSPYNFDQQNTELGAVAPCKEHWFGTDMLGRDLLTRVLHGGRISFMVGFVATFVSLTIGVSYGIISGWSSGFTDRIMMRIVDIMYGVPFIPIVILLMVAVDNQSIVLVFAAIGLVEWLTMARIIRGQTLSLRHQTYIQAANCMGQSRFNIFSKHLIPNLLGIIIVYATLTVPNVILLESFLSFIGLGVKAPQASWGSLIKAGADTMETHWWRLVFPSIAFSMTLFSLNFLGDGLRDAFDPKAR